jgi:hypothetical protein
VDRGYLTGNPAALRMEMNNHLKQKTGQAKNTKK